MLEVKQIFDFGPNTRGIDYVTPEGSYHGVVESGEIGNSTTCFYPEGEKVYTINSGKVLGKQVEAGCCVFTLDLRETGIDLESLTDPENLKRVIGANKDAIKRRELEPKVPFRISSGILHQTRGVGVLDIQVLSGYRSDTEIQGVYLSDYYQEEK